MSTKNEPSPTKEGDGIPDTEGLWQDSSVKDQVIDELEKELEKEKTDRRSERFVGGVVLVILFNIMIFSVLPTLGSSLAILFLEIIVLLYFAEKLEQKWFSKIMSQFSGILGGK